jgi:hypothetical protein
LLIGDKNEEHKNLNDELIKLDLFTDEGLNRQVAILNEMNTLGEPVFFFGHSISEGTPHVYLHPQILSDYDVIIEIIEKLVDSFDKR